MKRKQRFVTPKVTRAVPLYLEQNLLAGSTLDDQTVVSAGMGVENYLLGDGEASEAASYIEYSE